MEILCPCDSGKKYSNCCKNLHDGVFPENALSLMRSRYAAYVLHNPEYIIRTTHLDNPSYLKDYQQWTQEILKFCQNTQFEKLDILEVIEGIDQSYVTFIAHLVQNGLKKQLIEKSYFVKEKEQWLYRGVVSINIA